MRYLLSYVLTVMMLFAVNGQNENFLRHKVQKSETVTQIAQKYSVTPAAIFKLNPDAYNGIAENQILLVPKSSDVTTTVAAQTPVSSQSGTQHLVQSGETLYSISRKYGISVDAISKANPILSEGLKSGQTIVIPGASKAVVSTSVPVANSKKDLAQTHEVQPGETKFSIAKKYGISVAELEKQNPFIKPGLPAGATLKIVSETKPDNSEIVEKPKAQTTVIEKPGEDIIEIQTTTKKTSFANYEVKPQETLYSLAQRFGITQDELIALNPTLAEGVKTGMILKVPGKGSIVVSQAKTVSNPSISSTFKGMNRKKVVLLLPFNAQKITADTVNGVANRLKKESFLNLTLDFYAGAMMAIDSAKTLGMNFDIKILDSEESKTGSSINHLSKSNDLLTSDAIIGPFYQQYAEKLAEALPNVPVISPLSKESGKSLPNLYQAMPSDAKTKKFVLDFLNSKNANVIVINDPKRGANREMIKAQYPNFKFVEVEGSGSINAEKLKALLSKSGTNYVLLDTERTGMILSATNTLLTEVGNYPIQLVIMEQNDTLEFEEISMKRLTVLKLMYPSVVKENESAEARIFKNSYRDKNKVFPSQYATRGFDVTFDTLLRLSTEKPFAESLNTVTTEQIESKFSYEKEGEGNVNQGIYLLQYNEDLSVTNVPQ